MPYKKQAGPHRMINDQLSASAQMCVLLSERHRVTQRLEKALLLYRYDVKVRSESAQIMHSIGI